MSETNEEVKVTKDEKTGDTIMKKPTRYKRLDPTTQELAAEEELKAREEANGLATEEVEEVATTPEEESFKKRYGDLRRHAQKQADDKDKEIAALKQQLSQATEKQIKLPKTDEELDAWSAEYPDVARIIETIAIKKSKEMNKNIEDRLENLAQKELKTSRELAERELLSIHPDFEEIRNDPSFHDWADEQPDYIQTALYDNETDAKAAARAIDLYKADKGIKKKRKSSKSAAHNVSVKGGSQPSDTASVGESIKESDVAKMTSQEYSANEQAIADAIRSGNFVYDISGAARQ
tara:strand:+ start:701 stop:1579 length:879 start_codon:yes stop_codon:yes gene_type:complete